MARPKINLTEKNFQDVEAWAALGLTNEQIALSLGISISSVYALKRRKKKFLAAIEAGKAKGLATISNALYSSAVRGNVQAQVHYLNARGGVAWRTDVEPEREDRPINLTINTTVTKDGS